MSQASCSMAYLTGPIDSILNEKGFTLEMLLDEDEIVVETKKGREDLIQLYGCFRFMTFD